MTKYCPYCKQYKPVSEFYKDTTSADGLRNKCKSCWTIQTLDWRSRNTEKYRVIQERHKPKQRERTKERRSLDKTHLFVNKRWRDSNKEKRVAQRRLATAVENGSISKGVCSICGTNDFIDAHHPDYSKPLDVVWLCRTHHNLEHQHERNG
jgi:hypothetical protein